MAECLIDHTKGAGATEQSGNLKESQKGKVRGPRNHMQEYGGRRREACREEHVGRGMSEGCGVTQGIVDKGDGSSRGVLNQPNRPETGSMGR